MGKVEVRKQQGLYDEALGELARIYTYALDPEGLASYYTQRALCGYLAGEYDLSLATTEEARFYLTEADDLAWISLLEALSAGEKGEWERSERAAMAWLASQPDGEAHKAQLHEFYTSAPKMRNPMVAWYLSLIPGVGQFYAGEVGKGVISLLVNGALGTFAVTEAIAGQWLSGWIVGCGSLSTSYFVGQERARMLTEERNTRLLRTHNDKLRTLLLD